MKKKSRKLTKLMILLLFVGFIYAGYYTVFKTDILHIKTVNVYDNTLISSEEIIDYLDLNESVSYFDLNQYEVKENVIEHPRVKNASVIKSFPNTLEIRVVERKPVAAVLYSETYLLVDEELVVVEVSKSPMDLYIINGYKFENFYIGYVINDDNSDILKNAIDLSKLIKNSDIKIHPTIEIVEDKIELYFNDEYKALFGEGNNIEQKYNDMLGIYKSQRDKNDYRGIINVSFEGQATFKVFEE